jgi:DNA (cytosine-5)-methyltransferase 1
MNYLQTINQLLKPKAQFNYQLIDLFAGCGGLSLGFEAVGFETQKISISVDPSLPLSAI